MAENAVKVGLVGCGTVGSGVVRLLVEQADLYTARMGRPIEIGRVLCRAEDVGEATAQVPDGRLVHDVDQFFSEADDCRIILELAGGKAFAKTVVERAIKAGKHVVTANKALLAAHGRELFALAREHGVSIAFEASCGGGIPIITAMQHNLASNRIDAMYGILNGTCNYILTQMTRHGVAYDDALAEAQARGYAEADPTLDVGGGDAAHKLAILASLAFGAAATDEQVRCTGIDTLDLADVRFGAELGYELKLLAIGERTAGGLSLQVAPCFVARDEQLAQVGGSFNALSVFGHAVGHTLYYGRGAGQMPTASAVVGDVLSIVAGAYPAVFTGLRAWPDLHDPPRLIDPDEQAARYYLRFSAKDVPGVAAQFTRILGDEGISIAAVLQHESQAGQFVPVVITTHEANDGAVRRAAAQLAALKTIQGPPVIIRIV
ncbi:MAG: homoserine dehydrogenase, partial [Planctomycetes bacterium]|nr:homoserine dehydrogenase [Planctomycetota bacterium]